MDGYIKKSEAVDVIVKYPYDIAGKTATAIKMIEDLPSADVVPKSEVESIITLNSQLEAKVFEQRKEVDRLKYNLKAVLEEIPETKREFAREIFADVNMQIIPYSTDIYIKGEELIIIPKSDYNAFLAELEKKYIGG